MVQRYYANAPATTLTSSCTAVATSISVASTSGLPIQYPYTLIIDRGTASEEVVLVTAAVSLTLTVTRGYDSTTAFAHAEEATVEHGISAIDPREANDHVNASDNVHGITGDVVGTSDTQALTNKDLSSGTNTFPSSLATDAELAAHEADTTTHGTTGNIVGTSDTQTLTNKTISADSNTLSGIAASSFVLSNGSGNIDGSASQKAIPSGVVVGTTDTQTLTNKTLDAPTITGVGQVLRAIKTADESVNNTDTLQDDNHLTVSLSAGTYIIDMWITATAASSTTPDLKMALTYSGTHSAINYGGVVAASDMTGVSGSDLRTNIATSSGGGLVMGLNTANGNGIVRGFIVATGSGSLTFQFAQNTATAENVTVRTGSWLRAERVA